MNKSPNRREHQDAAAADAMMPRVSTILIVEDHFETNRAMRKLFESAGHHVTAVFSGEAGLASLEDEKPDVVVLDQLLPGIDGLEVLRSIRANPDTKDLPVVVYSAVADGEFANRARGVGATDVWLKGSFGAAVLRERIGSLLSA